MPRISKAIRNVRMQAGAMLLTWFGVNGSLHAEILERNTSMLNNARRDDAKTDLLKERTRCNAHVGSKKRDVPAICPCQNSVKQLARDPLALKLRMNVQKIEMPVVPDSGETRNPIVALANEGGSLR